MVIQIPTVLTSGGSGVNSVSYTTNPVSPDEDSLLVLFVDSAAATSGENDTPTLTDTLGFDWTIRDTATGFDGTFLRGTIFTAEVPEGGDSGTITINFAHLQSGCHWHLVQVRGGRNDDPIVQAGHSIYNTTHDPSFNLPAPPDASSLVLAMALRNGTTAYAAGTGHTILSTVAGSSGPAVGSDISYDMAPAQQAVGFLTDRGEQKTLFGVEIAMGGEVAPPVTPAEATLVRKWKLVDTLATNTIPIVAPHDIEIGETLVIALNRVTGASPQPISSVTGIGTNVATVAAESIRSATHITDIVVIPITQQILNGATITVNIVSGVPSRKAVVCSVWAGLTGEVSGSSGMTGPNGSTSAASVSTAASVAVTKSLILAAFGRGNVIWTPDAGNTLVDEISTTVGSTDRGVSLQSRVETSTGVKSSSGVLASGSWAAAIVALRVASAAAGAPVVVTGGNLIDKEPGSEIHLSAADSTGSGTLTYVWTQEDGEPVDYYTDGPDLYVDEAPWTIAGTELKFRVTVTASGLSSAGDVSVFVLPATDRIMINGVEVALKIVPA